MNTNPTYDQLIDNQGKPQRWSYAQGLHPNPRFYKYYWRVFHKGTPEGAAFFDTKWLSTYETMKLLEFLSNNDEGYLLYNRQAPRGGSDTPFDLTATRWKGVEIAASFDEDPDPEWKGHK